MRRISVGLCSVALVVLSIGVAPPATAATPVTITGCASGTGVAIPGPGNYKLKKAVHDCASNTIIDISFDDVVLDLGGLLVDGIDTSCNVGVFVNGTNIVVKNGAVADCDIDVNMNSATKSVAQEIIASSADQVGVAAGTKNTVTGCHIRDNVNAGVSGQKNNTITNNDISHNPGDGVSLSNTGNVIDGNTINGNGQSAIDAFDETITNNAISGNGSAAISAGGTIAGNVVSGNANDGINSADGAIIKNNQFIDNDRFGILAGKGGVVSGNTVTGNGDVGIHANDEITIKNNIVKGNGSDSTTGDGISIDAVDDLINKTKIVGNTSNGSDEDGIRMADNVDDETVKIADNTVNGNGRQGINLAVGSNIPPLAGSNHARGNVFTTPECDGGLCA